MGHPIRAVRCGRIDWPRDASARRDELFDAPRGRRCRSARRRQGPERRPAPLRRDRAGAVARCARRDHGRADRRAVAARDPATSTASSASSRPHGTAVIFISHKFDEIFAVADRYTVLRDGQFVGRRARRPTSTSRAGRADGRPRGRPDLPEGRGAARRAGARGRGPLATRPSSTASASRCAAARSSASTAWSAPAARRSCRRCSA